MNISKLVGRLALILIHSACFAPAAGTNEVFDFIKGSAHYHENGTLKKACLRRTAEVEGYSCKNWIGFSREGRLAQFQLAEDREIQGILIPENSTVFLNPDGRLASCWLSRNTKIQDILCDGGIMKVTTVFHTNGMIACCFLAKSALIQNIPCEASVLDPVYFYETGKLKSCTLSESVMIEGRKHKKGSKVSFDENGGLLKE